MKAKTLNRIIDFIREEMAMTSLVMLARALLWELLGRELRPLTILETKSRAWITNADAALKYDGAQVLHCRAESAGLGQRHSSSPAISLRVVDDDGVGWNIWRSEYNLTGN